MQWASRRLPGSSGASRSGAPWCTGEVGTRHGFCTGIHPGPLHPCARRSFSEAPMRPISNAELPSPRWSSSLQGCVRGWLACSVARRGAWMTVRIRSPQEGLGAARQCEKLRSPSLFMATLALRARHQTYAAHGFSLAAPGALRRRGASTTRAHSISTLQRACGRSRPSPIAGAAAPGTAQVAHTGSST
jgi:hypothetical protein